MKILLCKDVESLGYLGDVVDVKNGYARNYLLPQGVGIVPTDANIKSLADAKSAAAAERRVNHDRLATVVEAVEGAEVVVASKANEQGHLFGSVSQREIAENLRGQGFEITDDMVRISEHIKEVGTHEVAVRVAAELSATISVVVVSQDETVEAVEEETTEE
ncbi:MAG: 50S ribosomal protein L9 [Planctomycetes bacterium]|nr:50S ribosomal protein L9 [Planctomycetota bacterium]